MSYWQITYSRGTLYNVPQSCCVQRQEAYPPDNILPVDDWCQFYEYNSTGQLSAVYTQVVFLNTCTIGYCNDINLLYVGLL